MLHAFSITRPLNARLCKARPEFCMVQRAMYKVVILSSYENCALALSSYCDIATIFEFKLLANYDGNYECHDEITVVTIY